MHAPPVEMDFPIRAVEPTDIELQMPVPALITPCSTVLALTDTSEPTYSAPSAETD